jgi:putative FmdB family regulatory protein
MGIYPYISPLNRYPKDKLKVSKDSYRMKTANHYNKGEIKMPLFDYECGSCHETFEGLYRYEDDVPCPKCGAMTHKLPGAASFKIKGLRAANGYGLKFVDSYGKSKVEDKERGCSFTSNRGGTIDKNHGLDG